MVKRMIKRIIKRLFHRCGTDFFHDWVRTGDDDVAIYYTCSKCGAKGARMIPHY
jgi:hypothetical protein